MTNQPALSLDNLSEAESKSLLAVGLTNESKYGLTHREKVALVGVIAGMTNLEIANAMFVAMDTAKNYVSTLRRKMGEDFPDRKALRRR